MAEGASLRAVEREALAWLFSQTDPEGAASRFGAADPTAPFRLYATWRNPENRARLPARLVNFGLKIVHVGRAADGAVEVDCIDPRGRPWIQRLCCDDEGQVTSQSLTRPLPAGYTVRPMREAESEKVAQMEWDHPIINGARRFSLRRRRYAELRRFHEENGVWVVERDSDGEVVAMRSAAMRTAMFGGREIKARIAFQAVVAPDERGHGLDQIVNSHAMAYFAAREDGSYGYIDPNNEAIRAALRGGFWNARARQLMFAAEHPVSFARGRTATSADIPAVTRLLAAAHAREELRPAISEAWLAERLARMPSYGLADLLMTDDAMIGVWLAADDFLDEGPDRSRRMRVGYIADYGFVGQRGLEDLLGLLTLHAQRAAERGITHLIGYTSDGSPASSELQREAAFNDEMVIQGSLPEPADVASRGIYTDPFYV